PRYAPGHWIVLIAALGITEAIRIEIILAGSAVNGLGSARVQGVKGADDVGVGVARVTRAGWTFRVIRVLLPEVREYVEGQAGVPGHDGEKAPACGQTLGASQAVEGQVPA